MSRTSRVIRSLASRSLAAVVLRGFGPVLLLAAILPLSLVAASAQTPEPAQAPAKGPGGDMVLFAVINGGQESAGGVSDAFGVGFFTFDSETAMLCYAINYTDLAAEEVGAHFHGPAQPGEDADVLFDISTPAGSPKEGCVGPLSNQERNFLKKGRLYVNVHSSLAPAGEIRGQLVQLKEAK